MSTSTLTPTQERYCKLICISADGDKNNNKFYEMTRKGNQIEVKYGRVESTSKTIYKSYDEWDRIYHSKLNKGKGKESYVDVTDLVSTTVVDTTTGSSKVTFAADTDAKVQQFINLMKSYTDKRVSVTYSVKAENVSQKQIDAAQQVLNDLKNIDVNDQISINAKLMELYRVIPRYMKKVKDHVLPQIKIEDILETEQDNLDAIAVQVKMQQPVTKEETKKVFSILDELGITMVENKTKKKELQYIVDQLSAGKIQAVFEANKPAEESRFNKWVDGRPNKETRYLIHGTRCTSVIPILREGLKIHPTGNYQFSGKIYGDGNYFSEKTVKSLGYTGYDNDKVLLIYEVHTGNPYVYYGRYNGNRGIALNYKALSTAGYDSTHVEAGGGLLNSEIIAYHEHQNTLRYVIWLKS
jgi:predicted DNA-binding WGR domain protein